MTRSVALVVYFAALLAGVLNLAQAWDPAAFDFGLAAAMTAVCLVLVAQTLLDDALPRVAPVPADPEDRRLLRARTRTATIACGVGALAAAPGVLWAGSGGAGILFAFGAAALAIFAALGIWRLSTLREPPPR